MNSFTNIVFTLAMICIGAQVCSSFSLPKCPDLDKTNEINKKLCEAGTHDDAVAAKFFACYDNVPGKDQYIACQKSVYGNPMDTKEHIDVVCTANKFPAYATCLAKGFFFARVNPIQAIRQLNACQGPVMGV